MKVSRQEYAKKQSNNIKTSITLGSNEVLMVEFVVDPPSKSSIVSDSLGYYSNKAHKMINQA